MEQQWNPDPTVLPTDSHPALTHTSSTALSPTYLPTRPHVHSSTQDFGPFCGQSTSLWLHEPPPLRSLDLWAVHWGPNTVTRTPPWSPHRLVVREAALEAGPTFSMLRRTAATEYGIPYEDAVIAVHEYSTNTWRTLDPDTIRDDQNLRDPPLSLIDGDVIGVAAHEPTPPEVNGVAEDSDNNPWEKRGRRAEATVLKLEASYGASQRSLYEAQEKASRAQEEASEALERAGELETELADAFVSVETEQRRTRRAEEGRVEAEDERRKVEAKVRSVEEERQRMEAKVRLAEEEKQRMEAKVRLAEEERREMEGARDRAEDHRRVAEQERQRAEAKLEEEKARAGRLKMEMEHMKRVVETQRPNSAALASASVPAPAPLPAPASAPTAASAPAPAAQGPSIDASGAAEDLRRQLDDALRRAERAEGRGGRRGSRMRSLPSTEGT